MSFSLAMFSLCALALLAAAAVFRRRDPEATLGGMFDRALEDRTVRLAVIVIWWWIGWHFLAGQTL